MPDQNQSYSRRDFLKGAAASLTAGGMMATAFGRLTGSTEYGILIDTTRCKYCRKCIEACAGEHQDRYPGTNYTHVNLTYPRGKDGGALSIPMRCLHCSDPPCVTVCEGNALEQTPEGAVRWQADNCVGCLSCISVCPFQQSLQYQSSPVSVFKCDMCYDRIAEGSLPACVQACQAIGHNALSFGKLEEITQAGRERAEAVGGRLFYPGETHTLVLLREEDYNQEMMTRLFGLEESYPPQARVKQRLVQAAHFGWISILGGLGFLAIKWRKNSMDQIVKIEEDKGG